MKFKTKDGNIIVASQEFVNANFPGATLVEQELPAVPDPVTRHISVGAFFDRFETFGGAKLAILADTTPSVQAVVKDASVRQFIDLDNPSLPMGLQVIIQAGHEIDAESILSAPIQPHEKP